MPDPTGFRCPKCGETYALHWHADDGSEICRNCANQRDGLCQFADHPDHGNPCSYGTEAPGTPCRYCAAPVPLDGSPCPECWLSFEGMAFADIRAVFAGDGTFDTTPTENPNA